MSEETQTVTVDAQLQNEPAENERASYASAGEDTVCNSYLQFSGEPAQFIKFIINPEEAASTATLARTTSNYAVYDEETGAVEGLYVNKDTFEGEPPEEIGLSLAEGSEEDFEEAVEEQNGEAEELFA